MSESSDLDVFTLKILSNPRGRSGRVYRLMREAGGQWSAVGTYGSFADAADAIDQAVGRGEGVSADYRIDEVRVSQPTWKKVLKRVALAFVAVLFVAVLAVLVRILLTPGPWLE